MRCSFPSETSLAMHTLILQSLTIGTASIKVSQLKRKAITYLTTANKASETFTFIFCSLISTTRALTHEQSICNADNNHYKHIVQGCHASNKHVFTSDTVAQMLQSRAKCYIMTHLWGKEMNDTYCLTITLLVVKDCKGCLMSSPCSQRVIRNRLTSSMF